MNLITSILAISIAMVLYIALIEIFAVLFRITGLTKEKAKFQVISMITCAGYTTSEAEIITTNRIRRRLAIACMISGNLFNVLIISLIINLISSISSEGFREEQLMWIFIILGSVLIIILFSKIPFIARFYEKVIEKIGRKMFNKRDNANILTMLDSYDNDAIVEIYINNIPDILANKSLIESNFKATYNLNILMLKRGNRTIEITKDTVIQNKDQIIIFGKKQVIKDLFTYKVDEQYEDEVINSSKENILNLIDNYGSDAMAEVEIHRLPEILNNKKLSESVIKTEYNLNVLMIKREGTPVPVTRNSIIKENDTIIIFGNYASIKKIFLEEKQLETTESN